MVEKGSDHSSDKSPSTPEQGVQRSCSSQSGRSGGKNSKVSRTPLEAVPPCQGLRERYWGGELENICQGPHVINSPDGPETVVIQ